MTDICKDCDIKAICETRAKRIKEKQKPLKFCNYRLWNFLYY